MKNGLLLRNNFVSRN